MSENLVKLPIYYSEWGTIVRLFHKETDRAAALLAGAYLDKFLGDCLQAFLVDHVSVHELFSGYSPLSSFSARIDVAFALGLFPTEVRTDLHAIRKVRNHFAHYPAETSFSVSPVRDFCSNLSTAKEYPVKMLTGEIKMDRRTNPRDQYLGAVAENIGTIYHLLIQHERRQIPPDSLGPKMAIQISREQLDKAKRY